MDGNDLVDNRQYNVSIFSCVQWSRGYCIYVMSVELSCLFSIFRPFYLEVKYLKIPAMCLSSVSGFVNSFPYSGVCLFSLTGVFDELTFLILMQCILSILSIIVSVYCMLFNKSLSTIFQTFYFFHKNFFLCISLLNSLLLFYIPPLQVAWYFYAILELLLCLPKYNISMSSINSTFIPSLSVQKSKNTLTSFTACLTCVL